MYKVGDKVRVNRDLKTGHNYKMFVSPDMEDYKNKVMTIKKVFSENGMSKYRFEENDCWVWTEDMFHKARIRKEKQQEETDEEETDENDGKFKNNDLVRIKNNYNENGLIGKLAIYKNEENSNNVGHIEFLGERNGYGHSGPGDSGTRDCCWYIDEDYLEKVKLKKCCIKDRGETYTIMSESFFEENNVMPLMSLYDYNVLGLKNGDIVELIYDITDEHKFVKKGNKYYIIGRRGLKELESEESEKEEEKMETVKEEDVKKLTKAIEKLSKQVSERSPFQQAMTEAIIEKGKDIATKDIEEELKTKLDKFIEDKYGVLPKVIKVQREEKERKMTGLFHKEFDKICKIVDANIPLMLVGGAGAGKNHTLEQVAEALELDFYTTNAINQEYKLTGFIDANGVYHETEFYKAFTNGGMFFLDEIDASCPEALIILNGAIANKYFDFPIGRVTANENFRVVCAGNTYGTGADMVYVGRNVLDGATLDRFVVLQFDYDDEVEKALAYDMDLFKFIRALREAVDKSGLRYIVSMRALINATKLLEIGMDKAMILKTSIVKNMQIDDINTIVKKIDYRSEWIDELKKLSDVND